MLGNNRGFTLVELLAAGVILMVALGPLLAMFVHGRTVLETGWSDVTAVSLAQAKMEELKRKPWRALQDEDPAPFPAPFDHLSGAAAVKFCGSGPAEITVTVVENTTGDLLCTLRARRACR